MMRPKQHTQFAAALQEARLSNHLKQRTLAEYLGSALATVIAWENGQRIPPPGTVVHLSRILHTNLLLPYCLDDVLRHYGEAAGPDIAYLNTLLEEESAAEDQHHPLPDLFSLISTPTSAPVSIQESKPAEDHQPAEQLYQLLAKLQRKPELISITNTFIETFSPEQER